MISFAKLWVGLTIGSPQFIEIAIVGDAPFQESNVLTYCIFDLIEPNVKYLKPAARQWNFMMLADERFSDQAHKRWLTKGPAAKHTFYPVVICYKAIEKWPSLMGKLTISVATFNSYVSHNHRVYGLKEHLAFIPAIVGMTKLLGGLEHSGTCFSRYLE